MDWVDPIQSIRSHHFASNYSLIAHRPSPPPTMPTGTHSLLNLNPMADAGNGGATAAAKNLGDIEISPQDDRGYRAIELPNGLQVWGLCGLCGLDGGALCD